MSSRNLYTRRMSRAELDIWLDLSREASPQDKQLATRFAQLEDSLFFLSSIEEEIVGGTAIFRDRTRLAVALVAVNHKSFLKEPAQLQLLKSSLPFFRSVTIHHVDAIVDISQKKPKLPFPVGFALNRRFQPMLESLGFTLEDRIFRYGIDVTGSQSKESSLVTWKATNDHEAVRDLFWRQNKTSGVDSSLVTLGWLMASVKNHLHTLEDDRGITAAVGFDIIDNTAILWPIIADFRLIEIDTLAQAIHERVLQTDALEIAFPILGTGQKELARRIADLCNGTASECELLLLRKQL
ncbi:MAG: hypothetical protein ACFFEX_02715 [Candidatus Thorarchaeota archaeon]